MPRNKAGRKAGPINNSVGDVFDTKRSISLREVRIGRVRKYGSKKVFTLEEEQKLVSYIDTVAKIQYGCTKKDVRELVYKFAKANHKTYPSTWDINQIAGAEWIRHFMYRHKDILAVRKPQPTSLSCATSFNESNVDNFFNNITNIYNRFGILLAEKIRNVDETGLSTVQKPVKVVTSKKCRQVGGVTSAEGARLSA